MLFADHPEPNALHQTQTLFAKHSTKRYLEMFSLFPNLPYELRHEIWRHFIPAPRVVKTRYDVTTGRILPGSAPPILLHVCKESRKFLLSAQRGFSMLFGTPPSPAAVCINVKTDAVQIDYYALKYNDIKDAELEAIIHLEIYGATLCNEVSTNIIRQLKRFQSLDTLSLVATSSQTSEEFIDLVQDHPPGVLVGLIGKLEASKIRLLSLYLRIEIQLPQYDNWKKPLINEIFTRPDGSRLTEEGEFDPYWSLAASGSYTGYDFAKQTMQRCLEDMRRRRAQAAENSCQ
ncbi:hypothetical protein O988_04349 [Pseudogymnoascus sp. VKM F-3808]|nr:hypothetical protein O988_04349 [Pseudogymnoascus sp. VKM F-3808]